MMTTDGGAQAGEAVPTGQRIEAFRAAYNDGVYLRAAVRPARVHGALGLLLAACDERTRERDALAAQVAALTAERDGLLTDLIHFAQTNHQAHHGDHSGTWLSCDRGSCPGLRRAVSRARGDTTPPAGAQEGNDGR